MATGTTPLAKQSNNCSGKQFTLSYEGKESLASILAQSYYDFSPIAEVSSAGISVCSQPAKSSKQLDTETSENQDRCVTYTGDTKDQSPELPTITPNSLFYGDNKDALLFLLNNGFANKVGLVYIDPPYATSMDFLNREQNLAYCDTLCGADYLEFLRVRLILLRELLAPTGSIYLHLDSNMIFAAKILMDEIFGPQNCRAFITRKKCSTKNSTRKSYGDIADYLLFYSKGSSYTWQRPMVPWEEEQAKREYPCIEPSTGRRYKKVPIHAPGVRSGETGKPWRGMLPPKGKHWQYSPATLDELDAKGEIYWSPNGNPRRKVFLDQSAGVPRQNIWLDFRDSTNQNLLTTGYPTEKNHDMLKMIVEASSAPNDIVLDCFAGSGTTLGAASELGRKWIGIDNSLESIKAILKRLHGGMEVYGDYVGQQRAAFSSASSYSSAKQTQQGSLLSELQEQSEQNELSCSSNDGNKQKPHCPTFNVWSDHEHMQELQQTLGIVLGAQATQVAQTTNEQPHLP